MVGEEVESYVEDVIKVMKDQVPGLNSKSKVKKLQWDQNKEKKKIELENQCEFKRESKQETRSN